MIDVDVAGLKELDAALGEIPAALRRNVVLAALRKAAKPIVKDARARARRGTDPKRRGSPKQRKKGESESIGHGADSIRVSAIKSSVRSETAVAIGPDAKHWYMSFVEFGTSRQAPDRFLTPAFEINKDAAIKVVGDELWKSLARTAKRLARQAETGKLSKKSLRALQS